jgi:hypothetical protein
MIDDMKTISLNQINEAGPVGQLTAADDVTGHIKGRHVILAGLALIPEPDAEAARVLYIPKSDWRGDI